MTKPLHQKNQRKSKHYCLLFMLLCVVLACAWFTYRIHYRQSLEQYKALPTTSTQDNIHIRWFGTAAILLDDGKTQMFIDPYFSRISTAQLFSAKISPNKERIRYWLKHEGITKLDAILVSHSHFDHALDAPFIAKETGATLFGSASTANIARGQGLPEKHIQIVTPETPVHVGDFTLTFIPSKHGGRFSTPLFVTQSLPDPSYAYQYRMGEVYSILIQHPKGTFLHHASAGFIPGNLNHYHADNVFLGIALNSDTHAYIENVVKAVGAHNVYPMHWDDFSLPLDEPLQPLPFGVDINGFLDEVKADYPDLTIKSLPLSK